MNQETREVMKSTIATLRGLGMSDGDILSVLVGDKQVVALEATGQAGRETPPAVAVPIKPTPLAAPKRGVRTKRRARTGKSGSRKTATKKDLRGTREAIEIDRGDGQVVQATVSNRELGVFRRESGRPDATRQDVAEAKVRGEPPWKLGDALKRLPSTSSSSSTS